MRKKLLYALAIMGLVLALSIPMSTTSQAVDVVITTVALANGDIGVPYSQNLVAAGGSGSYNWSISGGSLPAWATLTGNTISGTPDAPGTTNFTVQVDDGTTTATRALAITINPALTITTTSLANGVVGIFYSQTLAAAGGSGIYAWSIIAGSLPGWATLSGSTISGTPNVTGTTSFTVRVSDGISNAARVLAITVFAAAVDTGNGIASFSNSDGTIEDLIAVDENTLPTAGKPNITFPFGLFSFNITGLTYPPGQTVYVTITLPSAVPMGTQYWKYQTTPIPGWIQIQPVGDDDGDNVIIIPLVDGGPGDADGTVNGIIVDPGGPAVPSPNLKFTKTAALSIDADGDGVPSPGDTIKYTATITNDGNGSAFGVTFSDTPDANTTLITGSVTKTQGSISKGNSPGDKRVEVSLGTIPGHGMAKITFEVTINHPLWEHQIANQAIAKGTNFSSVKSDDPGTPQLGDPTIINIQPSPPVDGPGVSFWGSIVLVVLLGSAMVWIIRKRQIRSGIH